MQSSKGVVRMETLLEDPPTPQSTPECSTPVPDKPDITAFLQQGQLLLNRGDYAQAAAQFRMALAHEPRNAEARVSLGDVLRYACDFDGAIAEYSAALQVDPENAPAFCRRGEVHLLKVQPRAAVADFSEALRIDPDF